MILPATVVLCIDVKEVNFTEVTRKIILKLQERKHSRRNLSAVSKHHQVRQATRFTLSSSHENIGYLNNLLKVIQVL